MSGARKINQWIWGARAFGCRRFFRLRNAHRQVLPLRRSLWLLLKPMVQGCQPNAMEQAPTTDSNSSRIVVGSLQRNAAPAATEAQERIALQRRAVFPNPKNKLGRSTGSNEIWRADTTNAPREPDGRQPRKRQGDLFWPQKTQRTSGQGLVTMPSAS